MFGGKKRHVCHPNRTRFFVSCPRLDATDSKQAKRAEQVRESSSNTVLLNFIHFLKDPPYCHNVLKPNKKCI